MTPTVTLSLEDYDKMRGRIEELENKIDEVIKQADRDFWDKLQNYLTHEAEVLRRRNMGVCFEPVKHPKMPGFRFAKVLDYNPKLDVVGKRITFWLPQGETK